jgi:hypothetical protein
MRFHITTAFLVAIHLPKGESRAIRSRHSGGGTQQNRRNRRFLSNKSSSKSSQGFSQQVDNAASFSDLQMKPINKMPATLATKQQCDPSATARETDMRELDVGILSCPNDQECVTSQDSILGGVCVPRGRMLQTPTEFCETYYYQDGCDCTNFATTGKVACERPCYIAETTFTADLSAQLYEASYCYFSRGGEVCIDYYYFLGDDRPYTEISLDGNNCDIEYVYAGPTCSKGGYSFNCGNGGFTGTFCYFDRTGGTYLYCPSEFYEDKCGDDAVAADTACDCTMWGESSTKTISCGDDSSCIGFDFDFDESTVSLSDGVCLELVDANTEAETPVDANTEAGTPVVGADAEAGIPVEENTEAGSPVEENTEAATPVEENTEAGSPVEETTEAARPVVENTQAAATPAFDSRGPVSNASTQAGSPGATKKMSKKGKKRVK